MAIGRQCIYVKIDMIYFTNFDPGRLICLPAYQVFTYVIQHISLFG